MELRQDEDSTHGIDTFAMRLDMLANSSEASWKPMTIPRWFEHTLAHTAVAENRHGGTAVDPHQRGKIITLNVWMELNSKDLCDIHEDDWQGPVKMPVDLIAKPCRRPLRGCRSASIQFSTALGMR